MPTSWLPETVCCGTWRCSWEFGLWEKRQKFCTYSRSSACSLSHLCAETVMTERGGCSTELDFVGSQDWPNWRSDWSWHSVIEDYTLTWRVVFDKALWSALLRTLADRNATVSQGSKPCIETPTWSEPLEHQTHQDYVSQVNSMSAIVCQWYPRKSATWPVNSQTRMTGPMQYHQPQLRSPEVEAMWLRYCTSS